MLPLFLTQNPKKTMIIDLFIIGFGTALIFGLTYIFTPKTANK
jgi:hypothetical protein